MPLGGDEVHSGYKGYGLSMVVDLLGAVLAGKVIYFNFAKNNF